MRAVPKPDSRLRRCASRLALVLLGLALGASIAEVVARIRYPVIHQRRVFRPGIYEEHEERAFALAKNYRGLFCNYFEEVPVQVNSLGFRGEEPPADQSSASMRVLCLGDSNTFGIGVGEQDTYPAQLQSRLRKRLAGAIVWNTGVPGYSTPQELEALREFGPLLKPDVVTLGWLANDVSRALEVEPSYRVFGGYLAEDEAAFQRFERKQLLRGRYEQSRFAALVDVASKLWQFGRKTDRLAEDAAAASLPRVLLERNLEQIEEIAALSRSLGARFVVIVYVTLGELVHGNPGRSVTTITELLRQRGIEVVPLWGPFRRAFAESEESLFVPRDNGHPNSRGHELTAEEVADLLLAEAGR